jgi:hypothetical protein
VRDGEDALAEIVELNWYPTVIHLRSDQGPSTRIASMRYYHERHAIYSLDVITVEVSSAHEHLAEADRELIAS